jgi:hypothetical protein
MPESFLALSATDRRDALGVAGEASGRPPQGLSIIKTVNDRPEGT